MVHYPDSIRGLGNYMKEVAKHLKLTDPMNFKQAHALINYMDEGYAAAVLIRLRERGIAHEFPDYTYVRGPNWPQAAIMYKWEGRDEVPLPTVVHHVPLLPEDQEESSQP